MSEGTPQSPETKQELKQRIMEILRGSAKPLAASEIGEALGTDLDYSAWSLLKELEREGLAVWVEDKKGWCAK